MRQHVTRTLPYTPDQMFNLVGDVESYPLFVPWLTALRTWNARTVAPGVESLDAEAQVGFAVFRERFTTRVTRDANARLISVDLISGPFKSLRNRWRFSPDPAGVRIEFDIDFAFRSRILEALLAANHNHAVERLIACFEARAKSLYGEAV